MADTKIKITNLAKSFGTKKVLTDINLEVKKGESLVIIGGSGSGKSVFLKCMLGLMTPTSGQVFIDDIETSALHEKHRYELMNKFGMLFQSGALFDSMYVWENVGFGLIRQGMKPEEVQEKAIEKLSNVGLAADVAFLKPSSLSGGMQKRVALARAICLEPEIIFYDEPTTGLDPIMADVIDNLIIKLKEDLGVTSVTITHDMKSAYKIADSMAMLYNGELIAQGNVKEIQNSTNPYVKQFINGDSNGPIELEVKSHAH